MACQSAEAMKERALADTYRVGHRNILTPSHQFLQIFMSELSKIQQNPKTKNNRSRQDSNLCGETPLDFESNSLTTRPSQPCHPTHFPHQLKTTQQPPSGPKKCHAANRVRTCAGRSHWISSPTP